MIVPDGYTFVYTRYENPYVLCIVCMKEQQCVQMFQIQNMDIQKACIEQLLNTSALMKIEQGRLFYIRPYVESTDLFHWIMAPHPLKELLALARLLIFQIKEEKLPLSFLSITLDLHSIGITQNNEAVLFLHPSFTSLLHPSKKGFYECLSMTLLELFQSAKEQKHYRFTHSNPWKQFVMHTEQREFHSMEEIMSDIDQLESSLVRKHHDLTHVLQVLIYTLIMIAAIALFIVIVMRIKEYNARTYEGLPYIGNQATHT